MKSWDRRLKALEESDQEERARTELPEWWEECVLEQMGSHLEQLEMESLVPTEAQPYVDAYALGNLLNIEWAVKRGVGPEHFLVADGLRQVGMLVELLRLTPAGLRGQVCMAGNTIGHPVRDWLSRLGRRHSRLP